ncbi:MAG: hypothetical protein NZL99_01345, partial [Burkholderiaceae bacterium]|nr:hypothetical protein [Burkholderiaceae bacterium]
MSQTKILSVQGDGAEETVKTGYYTHRACTAHEMGSWHPESPARLAAINDHLIGIGLAPHLVPLEPPPATLEAIRRAHADAYLQQLQAKIPKRGYVPLDPDTAINPNSWEAALHAAGAVLDATDRVIAGELDNAFCAVRPPG